MKLFINILNNKIRKGILHVEMPDGTRHRFGEEQSSLEAHWKINNLGALARIATNGEYYLAQTYMDQAWDTPDLRQLLELLRQNFEPGFSRGWKEALKNFFQRANKIARSYSNVSHHYDVKEEVFRLFLDREMFYSCAYFKDPENSLEQAQLDKATHIAGKLLLEPGQRVLDIGCGWGSLAFQIAQNHPEVDVTGITLSKEQLRVAQTEAKARGLENVRFILSDYREHENTYDRIVSVGMLEHVGAQYLEAYFRRVNDLLNEGGVAMIHTIGSTIPPMATNAWIEKYIFPGGYIPSLSELGNAMEKSGMVIADVESWRYHYGYTLKNWFQRFQSHRDEIVNIMNDDGEGETFSRMWEFYLAACEVTFMYANLLVYQCQLAKDHGIVPITRDYLYPPSQ